MEPIGHYFKIGLIAAMAYPDFGNNPVAAVERIARDSYFDAVELNPIPPEHRKAVAKVLAPSHLTVCCGAQARLLGSGLNPNDLDEAGRQKAEQTLIQGVDEAAELGAQSVAFLSGKWWPQTRKKGLEQLLKTTLAVCRYAASKDIDVELEVFDYDIDKGSLIGPAPLAAQFAAQVRNHYQNFGLLVDLSHIPMTYETPEFVVRTLRPYITHLHMGNTVIAGPDLEAYGDEHPCFGFPSSENDIPQLVVYLQALRQEGFFNRQDPYVLSFEVKPRSDEDPQVVVANAKRVLNRAWALLD